VDSLGLKNTHVNSRTPGREEFRNINGWGQTTPNDMGKLLEMLHDEKIFSRKASERIMRSMGRNYWDISEAISMIPPYIEVFSKNGCVNAVRSEVMLVNAPNNPYVFCIFTKNNKDTSWTHENEAWTMARKLSAMLWEYFEPKDKWIKPTATE
jgi:beta-lactamase class A